MRRPTLTVKSVRRGLTVVQWLLLVAAGALLVDTAFFRTAPEGLSSAVRASAAAESRAPTVEAISLDELAPIWTRPLRQQLIEAEPTKEEKPPPPPTPPPTLPRLRATFVAAGRGWALFLDENGRPRVCARDGKIGEYSVVAIEADSATIAHGGKQYELRVPKEKAASHARRGRR